MTLILADFNCDAFIRVVYTPLNIWRSKYFPAVLASVFLSVRDTKLKLIFTWTVITLNFILFTVQSLPALHTNLYGYKKVSPSHSRVKEHIQSFFLTNLPTRHDKGFNALHYKILYSNRRKLLASQTGLYIKMLFF